MYIVYSVECVCGVCGSNTIIFNLMFEVYYYLYNNIKKKRYSFNRFMFCLFLFLNKNKMKKYKKKKNDKNEK